MHTPRSLAYDLSPVRRQGIWGDVDVEVGEWGSIGQSSGVVRIKREPPDDVRRLLNILFGESDYLSNINRLASWNLPATET